MGEAININTNARGIQTDNHKIRIVKIDIMGDIRCREPTTDPRGMEIVGAERDLLARNAARKKHPSDKCFACSQLAEGCMRVANVPWKNLTN